MNKKIIILLSFLIIFTGCEANYEINLNEKTFVDKLIFNENNQSVLSETGEDSYSNKVNDLISNKLFLENSHNKYEPLKDSEGDYIDIVGYYDIQKNSTNGLGATVSGKFDYYSLDTSTSFNHCFDNFLVTTEEKMTSFETKGDFTCFTKYPLLDKTTIKIISKNITESNADQKQNGTHVWILNKDNYQNKTIKFIVDKLPIEKKQIDVPPEPAKPEDEIYYVLDDDDNLEDKDDIIENPTIKPNNTPNKTEEPLIAKKQNKNVMLLVIICVIVISSILGFAYFKYRKNNKI